VFTDSPNGEGLTRRGILHGAARAAGTALSVGLLGSTAGSVGNLETGARRRVVQMPPPTGGDDTPLFSRACQGHRDVRLAHNCEYRIASANGLDLSGWRGTMEGNGAIIFFSYRGEYAFGLSGVRGLSGSTIENVTITAPHSTLFSVFRECANLTLVNVTVRDCAPLLTYGLRNGFSGSRIRWRSSESYNGKLNGSISLCDGGLFALRDFDYSAPYRSETGAIVSGVATRVSAPTDVLIERGRVFAEDRPGYTVDAAIDIEPLGEVPLRRAVLRDLEIYNSSVYISGCQSAQISGCRFVYTENNRSGRALPFVIYNSNRPHPRLDQLTVEDCEVDWRYGNSSDQRVGILVLQGHPGGRIALRRNRYTLRHGVGGPMEALYWIRDGAPSELRIDGDCLDAVNARSLRETDLVRTDSTPTRLIMTDLRIRGVLRRRLAMHTYGGGGDGELLEWSGVLGDAAQFGSPDTMARSIHVRVMRWPEILEVTQE